MTDTRKILDALQAIDPTGLDYKEWSAIGMALKHEGLSPDDWDAWSARDPSRYKRGECARKWATFNEAQQGAPVTGGTIVEMARQRGWEGPARQDWPNGGVLGWSDTITDDGEGRNEGRRQLPTQMLRDYLRALFHDDERICYVTKSEDGKPSREQDFGYTAGQVIASLDRHPDDLRAAIGDWNEKVGAWIRINPTKGMRDSDVTAFRHVLVESDELPVEEQLRIIRSANLPVAALVSSAGKSIHAVVRVNAPDRKEYARRVDTIFNRLDAMGLKVDKANSNPGRLSRLPGADRNGRVQELLGTNLGASSYEEWANNPDGAFPAVVPFSSIIAEPDRRAPVLIDGVLRKGHKMMIAGPSKAGKSFALMELCAALASGGKWMGTFPCRQCRVLYVNLEIDEQSAWQRMRGIYDALALPKDDGSPGNIGILSLRGRACPLNEMVPALCRAIKEGGYEVMILDPIYKVITGDENNASDMGKFCNQFDRICTATGATAIYCHHHSKGMQGGKKAMDRASGSGVFVRDPDALLDFSELVDPNEEEDDGALSFDDQEGLEDEEDATTAWRVEMSLREFKYHKPVNVWFRYPLHVPDTEGELDSYLVEGDPRLNLNKSGKRGTKSDEKIDEAYNALYEQHDPITVASLAEKSGLSESTVRRKIKNRYEIVKGGYVKRKEEDRK